MPVTYSETIEILKRMDEGGSLPSHVSGTAMVEAISDRIRKVNSETGSLRTRLRILEDAIGTSEDDAESAESKAKQLVSKLAKLQKDKDTDIEAKANRISELETEIKTVKSQLQEVEKQYKSELQLVQTNLETAHKKLGETEAQLTVVNTQISETEARFKEADTAVQDARARAEAAEAAKLALESEKTQLVRQVQIREAAETAKANPRVLSTLLSGDRGVTIEDGQVFVVFKQNDTDEKQPLADYAEANWADFLPSLFPQNTQPEETSEPPATPAAPTPRAVNLPVGGTLANNGKSKMADLVEMAIGSVYNSPTQANK